MRRSRGFGRKALLVACAMAVAIAFVLPTIEAMAASTPIPTKISLLKWGGSPRVGKLYKIVSKPTTPPPLPLCEPAGQMPEDLGGLVTVTVGDKTLTCDLQAAPWGTAGGGWKMLGKCDVGGTNQPTGYKYLNKSYDETNPCKVVILKEKVIKILAKGVGGIDMPVEGDEKEVKLSFDAGNENYCAEALPPHFKVKTDTLIKMKDQPAPASCDVCGDNIVNQDPPEECDGTDDGACNCQGVGLCLPPGDPNECTCAPVECGNNCREEGEQCDGADSSECEGLCLANCTCPFPVCNNGVKEVGEVCDPAGSTDDCPPGQVCGGFCECVDDVACNCGSPEPTLYMYRNESAAPGSVCGTADGSTLQNLGCGDLYIGGGGGALPLPIAIPDQGTTKWNVTQCAGSDLALAPTARDQVGTRHCSEGKRCVGGTNDGDPCIRDRECELGTCEARCFFGSYLSILNTALPIISTCVGNEFSFDGSAAVDCQSGRSYSRIPLDSRTYLTLADQSPSTPGHNPCPICVGGTLDVPDSGTCEGGPRNGLSCMPMSTKYDLNDCCAGGLNNSKPCTGDSDCPGSTCVPGCSGYPTSLDCPPNPATDIGGELQFLLLTTETNQATADAGGNFCGWCRDVEVEGSLCFEGDEDAGPPPGDQGCPDSAVIACRPETYHGVGGGDPADIAQCGDALSCRTDADCTPPYESCQQRTAGAWRDSTVREVTYVGLRSDPLADGAEHYMEIAGPYCIPSSFSPTIDGDADLGGPGGLSLVGVAKLSPSGAFLDLTSALVD